mgnify:CR=1 FL=1
MEAGDMGEELSAEAPVDEEFGTRETKKVQDPMLPSQPEIDEHCKTLLELGAYTVCEGEARKCSIGRPRTGQNFQVSVSLETKMRRAP